MDHGTLTDNNGRKVDFRNVVLIMTTNAGVQETIRTSIGFKQQDHSHDAMSEIKKIFTPEFRNRLDATVWFNHLDRDVILQVVDKFIVELQVQLDNKGVSLEVTNQARDWLADKGYDKNMGARPMARVIQQHVKKELAHELLFGRLTQGGSVKIALKNDALSFEFFSDSKEKPAALNS
jgi:ATP-dependent Clp protease ATP-binding subunit ClpA